MSQLSLFAKNSTIDPEHIIIEGSQALKIYEKTNGKIHQIILDEHQSIDHYSHLAPCHHYTRAQITAELGFRFHGGVLALAQKPALGLLSHIIYPAIYLNRITSPENVGSLARLAAGLGFKSLIYDYETCDPLNRRSIRVSTGNIFSLNIYKSHSYNEFLTHAKESEVVALELHERSLNLYESRWYDTQKLCFIVGGEGPGVHPVLLDRADKIVHVPQIPGFSSLNVSHAAAIAMSLRLSKVGH
jgi:tRNA G18 (ribose-2'-O)-methylase SpoU